MRTRASTFTALPAFFAWDDQRLGAMLDKVNRLLDDGHVARAEKAFIHYARGMKRHLRFGEEALVELHAFERAGTAKEQAATLPAEDARIVDLLDETQDALLAGDVPLAKLAIRDLTRLHGQHLAREEQLYPVVESLLGPTDSERLLARLARP